MENPGSNHPLSAFLSSGDAATAGHDNERQQSNPWEGAGFPFSLFQPRGGHHEPRQHGCSPSPPGSTGGQAPASDVGEKSAPSREQHSKGGRSESDAPGPSENERHAHHKSSTGRCGGPGSWGGKHRGFPFGPGSNTNDHVDLSDLARAFQEQLFGGTGNATASATAHSQDFRPFADVFDAPENYTVHVSLPGAKKEDVAVSWDAEKSELTISGVVYRPGDEELLKTLALDERKEVGAFERKVRLGSRVNPAAVDVEGITAKLEDGILRVEVPKLGDDGFVEVKKVEVE